MIDTMASPNVTVLELPPLPAYTLQPMPDLVPGIADKYLTLVLPVVAYWLVSMIFHAIDELDLFPQYRLHTPAEVLKRNHVTRYQVVRDVVIQQVVQTMFGVAISYFDAPQMTGDDHYNVARWALFFRRAEAYIPVALAAVGLDASGLAQKAFPYSRDLAGALAGGHYPWLVVLQDGFAAPTFASWEFNLARFVYWAAIPFFQFLVAICVVDTWQYFLHRAMHMNKWLYTTFHSRHHRLYVPYAFGALYNHPFEGFLLDTLGTGVGYLIAGLTPRQCMWFFTCSTIKTIDDHCGYAFPWDPLQHITQNNAGYHDVHHQSWGVKTNFSQPFFTFWDRFLGTKWVGGDVSARYERAKLAAQKKMDNEKAASITASTPADSTEAVDAPYESELQNATDLTPAQQARARPAVPAGKATKQAVGSRQQTLEDKQGGGASVLAEETAEEQEESARLRRSTRKRSTQSGSLQGLRDRVNSASNAFHGNTGYVWPPRLGRRARH